MYSGAGCGDPLPSARFSGSLPTDAFCIRAPVTRSQGTRIDLRLNILPGAYAVAATSVADDKRFGLVGTRAWPTADALRSMWHRVYEGAALGQSNAQGRETQSQGDRRWQDRCAAPPQLIDPTGRMASSRHEPRVACPALQARDVLLGPNVCQLRSPKQPRRRPSGPRAIHQRPWEPCSGSTRSTVKVHPATRGSGTVSRADPWVLAVIATPAQLEGLSRSSEPGG